MKRITAVLIVLCLVLTVSNAFAFTWTYSGVATNSDTNLGNPESLTGLTVGLGNVGDLEDGEPLDTTQPIQISGAGTLLPSGNSGFILNFHADVNTWDTYNASNGSDGKGYYDVFAAVLSENGYYWNLLDTGIHPLENNANLIGPYGDTSYWGGTGSINDDLPLEHDVSDVTLAFATDPTKQYYLTLFMQTMSDDDYSSWGTFSNVSVTPTPEPASMTLLGLGLLGMFGFKKKRR